MIASDTFVSSFGITSPGDVDAIERVAKAACQNGFAVVFNEPNSKKPICILMARQRKDADAAARDNAREVNDPNWERRRHACGIAHAITDPAEAVKVARRLIKQVGQVNLGVHVGRSRMLCIDADTLEQKNSFRKDWSEATGENKMSVEPTVISPGKMNTATDGSVKWVHKDGGHYWFTLPDDVNLAALDGKGILTADGEWVAIWGDKQVIVPPSIREEGPYRLVGQVTVAPQWLIERIYMLAEAHIARQQLQRARRQFEDDPIDGWSSETPWRELLEQDDWQATGLPDTCDCEIWTRPGGDASHAKSATAHELGCVKYDMAKGHGPLYLWTDNPPEFLRASGQRAFSKLQYLALRDHEGDTGAAMRTLGLKGLGGGEQDEYSALWTGGSGESETDNAVGLTQTHPQNHLTEPLVGTEVQHVQQPEPAQDAALAEEVEETKPVYPATLLEMAERISGMNLPIHLSSQMRQQAEQEWTREEHRRLKNASSAETIRVKMRMSVDQLSTVEEDDGEDLWRINGLWLQGQIAMLTAKYKAGKTTMMANLIRSLVDGVPFLDRFEVPELEGSVFMVNAEMTRRQFNRWMLESNIVNREKVYAFHVRDAGPAFGDITDPTRRDEFVALLNETGARVLILDPLNPLFAAAGIDENSSSEVASWFTALNDIVERTGVTEVMLVHHFGHDGSRARGSSKLMDAPDVLWTYTVEENRGRAQHGVDEEDDLLGDIEASQVRDPRYLAAVGRDVHLEKSLVRFNPDTRELSMPEGQNGQGMTARDVTAQRQQQAAQAASRRLVDLVRTNPGITSNAAHDSLGGNKTIYKRGKDEAVRAGQIRIECGGNRSQKLYLVDAQVTTSNTDE